MVRLPFLRLRRRCLTAGFIGSAVSHAFVRAGHIVWGQTRSQETADTKFGPNEIIPVVCDPTTQEGQSEWAQVAKQVDVGTFLHISIT